MSSLNEVDNSVLFCMFKGEPGTRKSTQALSFPLPQYWFSWDRKMESLTIPAKRWNIDKTKIHYDDYTDWDRARLKLEDLASTLKGCEYKTIIADSITSCADASLRQVLSSKKGTGGKQVSGISVNTIEDFNAESSALTELVALLKNIHKNKGVNVILIAHVIQAEYRSVQGETHFSRILVTAAKKIAAKIPAYCPEIYHFNIEGAIDTSQGGNYALLTQHTGDDFARTSLPLDKKIIFNDNPIYSTYLQQAINKQKE